MQTKVSLSTDIAVIVWLPVISPHDFVPGGPTPPLPRALLGSPQRSP